MKAVPRLGRRQFDRCADGLCLRIVLLAVGGGLWSDLIDMLRDHGTAWIEMKGLDEEGAGLIGVAEQSRLVCRLHKCGGSVLARDLIRRLVLLVARDEQGSVLEVLLRRFEVVVLKSLRSGEIDFLRLALFARRGRLLRRSLLGIPG